VIGAVTVRNGNRYTELVDVLWSNLYNNE